ncbi:MAG TPA: polysaccharide biosynthesis/export family protein, partial [Bryobacteraceae bacterium]
MGRPTARLTNYPTILLKISHTCWANRADSTALKFPDYFLNIVRLYGAILYRGRSQSVPLRRLISSPLEAFAKPDRAEFGSRLRSGCVFEPRTGDRGRAAADSGHSAGAAVAVGREDPVTVYNEPSLSGDFQIDPSGFVSLPLAGTLKAGGLTQNELEQALAQKYSSQYLKNPKVTVSVAEYRPFYIIGEVEHPGSFPYTSGLNVLSALAIAGGPTYRASKSTVAIQHPGESGL